MRKILAILCAIITLYLIKEMFYLFTTSDVEIIKQRPILLVIELSITIPLILLGIWLWGSKNKK